MKGLVAVRNTSMPDIVFLKADKQFINHINEMGQRRGLVSVDAPDSDHLDISIAMHFFSPIVASYSILADKLHSPYTSITTENDFLFVIMQCSDHLCIAVNGDGTETEMFLQRKLHVLHRLLLFYYGPISDQLRPDNVSERQVVWEEFTRVIDTWIELYNNEQSFLVEAVERLQVNQTVNEICISALEIVLRKLRGVGEKHAVHAMLMVDAKLLALYSSRKASELQSSDILLTMLLAQSFYPTRQTLESLLSQSLLQGTWSEASSFKQQLSSTSDEFLSIEEGPSDDGSSYYSPEESDENNASDNELPLEGAAKPRSKVRPIRPRQLSKLSHEEAAAGSNSSDSLSEGESELGKEAFFTPSASLPSSKPTKELQYSSRESRQAAAVAATVTLQRGSVIASENLESDRRDWVRMPAFLDLPQCTCTPHTLQFVPILPGTTMVIVSEVRMQLARIISSALYILSLIEQSGTDFTDVHYTASPRSLCDSLDSIVKQVCEHARKLKTSSMFRHQEELKECWHNVKRFGLQGYLDTHKTAVIAPRLESALGELRRLLKKIFRSRYMNIKTTPAAVSKPYADAIRDSQRLVRESLYHYQQYLSIKAQRNVTMTTYLEDYPGLVHFIHVDRKTDQITAPSIAATGLPVEASGARPDAGSLVKDKVWSIIPMMHEYLMQGYFTAAVRKGDFYYSYYLYFEDVTGKLIAAHKPLKSERVDMPGILTGKFYKNVVHHCFPGIPAGMIRCCELLCIHLAVVPIQYVTAHARRLCTSLWETSGEVVTPINLL